MSSIIELLGQLLNLSPGLQQALSELPYHQRMRMLLVLANLVLEALVEDDAQVSLNSLESTSVGSIQILRDDAGQIWVGWFN